MEITKTLFGLNLSIKNIQPRTIQLVSLVLFLTLGLSFFNFDTTLIASLIKIFTCVLTQYFFDRVYLKKTNPQGKTNWQSACITGLSLSLLLRTNNIYLDMLAAILAISCKFIFSYNGKHIFNPANFGIVLVLLTGQAWVSPGQWGTSFLMLATIFVLGGLTMWRALRLDVGLFFLFCWAGLLIYRAATVGDPISIPLHRLSLGSLFLFSFFMITDPRSTPSHPIARYIFAFIVAFVGWYGQTFYFKQDFLFYSLFIISILNYVLDKLFTAKTFEWAQLKT